ncbi:hypothetical protein ACE939_14000 [Aquimarina sp. W85]|uniref:hypothetical protein n=1 Tax=Aquimarina rhodophyticola TaxID=3342246 RepID=UPI0036710263
MKLLVKPFIYITLSTILLACFAKNRTVFDNYTIAEESKQFVSSTTQKSKKGTLLPSKNSLCPYILVVAGLKDTLDPINLKDFTKSKIPTNVWVTFSNLKMKNRCNQGRPVLIQSLKSRTIKKQ